MRIKMLKHRMDQQEEAATQADSEKVEAPVAGERVSNEGHTLQQCIISDTLSGQRSI